MGETPLDLRCMVKEQLKAENKTDVRNKLLNTTVPFSMVSLRLFVDQEMNLSLLQKEEVRRVREVHEETVTSLQISHTDNLDLRLYSGISLWYIHFLNQALSTVS